MNRFVRLATGTGLVFALSALAAPAIAGAEGNPEQSAGVVFVQTDNVAGNQIVAYDRSPDGTLAYAATYDTGGLGGALNGAKVDFLASQGSLTYDRAHGLLFAVNAGSNTVSVFRVHHDDLQLVQQISSGGRFPVSVASHGNLAYVLNAFDGGAVSAFWIGGGLLHVISGSTRSLGLTIPTDATQFTHTPGQVAVSPDGRQLIVTTKATTSSIDVFRIHHGGWLSDSPVVNAEPGAVPFAISFDHRGDLVIANAGPNSLSTYQLNGEGTLTQIATVPTGQKATCWVTAARGFLFASNAGSPSESGFGVDDGHLSLASTTTTDPGAVDAAASEGGRYLYIQAGLNGNVDEFRVNWDGSLTGIGSVTVPGAAGGEGIVAL